MTTVLGHGISSDEVAQRAAGKNLLTYFTGTVAREPGTVALRFKRGDAWEETTYGAYADASARIATGLRALGVGEGSRVCAMIRNRPEFHLFDVGALATGAASFSIYNSSSPEQIAYIAGHSEASVAIVEDAGFLERLLKVRDELPALEHIIVIDDPDGLAGDDVIRFADLLANEPADLNAAAAQIDPESIATFVYTSGTTGPPKAAIIRHRNIAWVGESLRILLGDEWRNVTHVSYLPMAHILERCVGHYIAVDMAETIVPVPEIPQLAETIREVHPDVFVGVPRVWEKFASGLQTFVAGLPEDQKKGIEDAMAVGRKVAELRDARQQIPADLQAAYDEADQKVLGLARSLLGLDRARYVSTGAAPTPQELIWFFRSLGLPLAEGWGMTETTFIATYDPQEHRVGTTGRPIPGLEVTIADDGEILVRGGGIIDGYYKDPEKTAESFDADGWLRTGDIGSLDADGYLRILDRKKELIITAGGKNISPANIEAELKSFPLIGQACVIGDSRPYLSALLVLDGEVAKAWAAQRGIDAPDTATLAEHPEVRAEVERSVAEANKRFSKVEQIKRFTLLPDEWQPDSIELTPTMKLKRRGINERYAAEIEALYA